MLRLDKHGSPYFDESEVDSIFNDAYLQWIDEKAKVGEISDRNRQDLGHLVRVKDFGSVSRLDLTTLNPSPLRIWAINANFSYSCGGQETIRTRPVVPVTFDRLGESFGNPNEAPDDYFPSYSQVSEDGKEDIIRIHSTSTPLESEVVYIKQPVFMDSAGNPSGTIEIGRKQQLEVANIALLKLEINIENQFRAGAVGSAEIQRI